MTANRRRLVHRLHAEDPLDLPASQRQVYPWKDRLGRPDTRCPVDLAAWCRRESVKGGGRDALNGVWE
jgi:hypothetical protein